jgi:hypothetical protein
VLAGPQRIVAIAPAGSPGVRDGHDRWGAAALPAKETRATQWSTPSGAEDTMTISSKRGAHATAAGDQPTAMR